MHLLVVPTNPAGTLAWLYFAGRKKIIETSEEKKCRLGTARTPLGVFFL